MMFNTTQDRSDNPSKSLPHNFGHVFKYSACKANMLFIAHWNYFRKTWHILVLPEKSKTSHQPGFES